VLFLLLLTAMIPAFVCYFGTSFQELFYCLSTFSCFGHFYIPGFILFLPRNPFLTSILFRYSCHFTCKFSCSILLVFLTSSFPTVFVFIISLDYARFLCHKSSLMFHEAGELKYSNTEIVSNLVYI